VHLIRMVNPPSPFAKGLPYGKGPGLQARRTLSTEDTNVLGGLW